LLQPLLQEAQDPENYPLFALMPPGRHQTAKVKVFIDFLIERIGSAPWRMDVERSQAQFVLGRQLRNRLMALDRLKRDLFELSRKPSPPPHGGLPSIMAESTLTGCLRKGPPLAVLP
jgi:hypothetical protein